MWSKMMILKPVRVMVEKSSGRVDIMPDRMSRAWNSIRAFNVGKGHDMGVQGLSCGGWICKTAAGVAEAVSWL